ncbi:MAG: hypothetical protein ACOYNI_12425 [Acidimicrobiia bacterium]
MTTELANDLAPELQLPVLASLASRGHQELRQGIDEVGTALEQRLPGRVQVDRRGWFRHRHVEAVRVTLDNTVYALSLESDRVRATTAALHGSMMRRRHECSTAEWVGRLLGHLEAAIDRSNSDQVALRRLASLR